MPGPLITDAKFLQDAERLALAVERRANLKRRGIELEVSFGGGALSRDWWHLTLMGRDAVTGARTFLTALPVSPEALHDSRDGFDLAAEYLLKDLNLL